MHRLKNRYRGGRAAVIFGGPSLVEQRVDLARLRNAGVVTFVDTQALTPWLLRSAPAPDYVLLLFPEKAKANGLQNFAFRAFLAQFNLRPCLKPAYVRVWDEMRARFDDYFESWRPHRGPHKRYRWKPNAWMADSPYDLLGQLPETAIIANRSLLAEAFPGASWRQPLHLFDFDDNGEAETFDLERYYNPQEIDGRLTLSCTPYLNSAAIALYPLLRFMGFRDVYLLGMDMSMLGALEYAALYTFRSMLHFRWFFARTSHVFNANYRPNRPFYLRPRQEFDDARVVLNGSETTFTRVYDPWKYAAPLEGVPTMSLAAFLRQADGR